MLKVKIEQKEYGDHIVLKNVLLEIDTPGIYGVIGKNGQGKTTLFKCILGLENYVGQSTLGGNNLDMRTTAWCSAEPAVYDELTSKEFYRFYNHLSGKKESSKALLFELPSDKLIKEFSTGMKKKVYLNAVLQREYEMYILDEPFNGLDIESNYYLMKYLEQLAKHSIILISSHIIDVLYKHCHGIFMVKNQEVKKYIKEEFGKIEEEFFK
ncbi:MAG: ATP-binding cassette domain-containing protein [Flavobacteriaceae bacterium]|jgi:ABC-2 type transport system ATP-binding protein|nr:ATP-binding cassette domain-containing protein [Flavobacteriaceae bacterium]